MVLDRTLACAAFGCSSLLYLVGMIMSGSVQAQTLTMNDGFEGTPQMAVTPPNWTNCGVSSSGDTQPGPFGNNVPPAQGGSYISLVTRGVGTPGTAERVWADLLQPFEQFSTYVFTVQLSLTNDFEGYWGWETYTFNNPCIFQVIGFNGNCENWNDRELLWQSDLITNFGWQTFTVTCTPTLNTFSRILIRPFFSPPTNYQNSALLIDDLVLVRAPAPDPPTVPSAANGLFVPNVFTPNGDELNGTWMITGTNMVELQATIYDRWGVPVHNCRQIGEGWTGRCGEGDCPDGVYFYVARVVFLDGQAITERGTISLLR